MEQRVNDRGGKTKTKKRVSLIVTSVMLVATGNHTDREKRNCYE
jgi:hypothetical protein